MRFAPVEGVSLAGTGSCRPSDLLGPAHALDNAAVAARLEPPHPDPGHFARAWGVHRRDWSALHPGPPAADGVDLGIEAARRALRAAAFDPAGVDALIFATSTPSRPTASDAHLACKALGIEGAAWDLRSGGAGGLIGWLQAAQAVASGARAALLVVAEVTSPYLDRSDPGSALYGDAAAAALLVPGSARLAAARAGHATVGGRAFTVPASLPPGPDDTFRAARPDRTYLEGLERVWAEAAARLAEDLGSEPADALLPYAVTASQVQALAGRVPARRVVSVLADHGCVGAAGPLVALDAWRAGGGRGGRLAAAAVGGGVSWATLVWED